MFPIPAAAPLRIGRGSIIDSHSLQVDLGPQKEASRLHAEISLFPINNPEGSGRLRCLGKSGCIVGGDAVFPGETLGPEEEKTLKHGDKITIAGSEFRFEHLATLKHAPSPPAKKFEPSFGGGTFVPSFGGGHVS